MEVVDTFRATSQLHKISTPIHLHDGEQLK